jgi:hypothetical protein
MAKSRKDCFDEIAGKTGKPRAEVEDALDEIFNRAEGHEYDGMGRDEAYERARDEFLQEAADQYARERRGASWTCGRKAHVIAAIRRSARPSAPCRRARPRQRSA